jgi:hypothetical protein
MHSTELNTLEVFGMEARAVLKELEELFPPVTPTPTDTMQTIMYRSGQRSIIEWLKIKLEK